jgi:hypothetical protein
MREKPGKRMQQLDDFIRYPTGEHPALFDCGPPKPRIETVRVDIVTH